MTQKKSSKKPGWILVLILIGVLALEAIGYEGYKLWQDMHQPVSQNAKPVVISIVPGSTFSDVAHLLQKKGLIRSAIAFRILATLKGDLDKIKAGEYELSPSMLPQQILATLVKGKIFEHVIIIPEGYNIFQIARLLDRAGLVTKKKFLKLCHDQKFLESLGLHEKSVEGYLFPNTYYFTKGVTAKKIISTMVHTFWKVWHKEGFDKRTKELGLTVHTVVTLASIVEKEAELPRERPIIASVFWNRLKKHMLLQSDPTVYYGLWTIGIWRRGRLHIWDLRRDTPYNTYIHKGLPPGPISNPGIGAIRAVLYPAHTKYLYFVSKNDGSHYFSCTLAQHNRAVFKYQILHSRRYRRELERLKRLRKEKQRKKQPKNKISINATKQQAQDSINSTNINNKIQD